MSEALAETFLDPEVVTHPGGHYFPAQASLKETYVDFFRDQLQQHLEAKELQNATEENSFHLEGQEEAEESALQPVHEGLQNGSDSDSD